MHGTRVVLFNLYDIIRGSSFTAHLSFVGGICALHSHAIVDGTRYYRVENAVLMVIAHHGRMFARAAATAPTQGTRDQGRLRYTKRNTKHNIIIDHPFSLLRLTFIFSRGTSGNNVRTNYLTGTLVCVRHTPTLLDL